MRRCKRGIGVVGILTLAVASQVKGQQPPVITSFQGGQIVWSCESGSYYRAEWRSDLLTGQWLTQWNADDPLCATGTTASCGVPMFFRVTKVAGDALKLVPGGHFRRGDPAQANQRPENYVYVDTFFLETNFVTVATWQEVKNWAVTNQYGFEDTFSGTPTTPMQASWYDWLKWCNARSEMQALRPLYYVDTGKAFPYRVGRVDVANDMVDWTATGYGVPTDIQWLRSIEQGTAPVLSDWVHCWDWYDATWYTNAEATLPNCAGPVVAPVDRKRTVRSYSVSMHRQERNGGDPWLSKAWCACMRPCTK